VFSFDVRIRGSAEMRRDLQDAATRHPGLVLQALTVEGEIEMAEAKRRTPVDTGALRASGHVSSPRHSGGTFEIDLAFGGPAAPYAAIVHEDPDAHHPVGQWKYLESVVLESAPYLAERVWERVKESL
jgi:hypothetical protein